MECKRCGGPMEIDYVMGTVKCPYCGSEGILNESDEVIKERIRSQAYRDVEFQKMAYEREKEERKRQEELQRERAIQATIFRSKKSSKFLAFVFFYVLLAAFSFLSNGRIFSMLLAVASSGCFGCAWLKGANYIPSKGPQEYKVLIMIGVALLGLLGALS